MIQELGLELEIIFNKGAVMVLPPGVNKASGLEAALAELGLSPHNAVGVGDAENDHAFLQLCECAVAVANALPVLKERCDAVTPSPRGGGVVELVDWLSDDLAGLAPELARHDVLVGEGYETFPELVHLGAHDRAPTAAEVLDVVEDPARGVVMNLLGSRLEDRPGVLRELLTGLEELRARTGRPHRVVIDEAHHLLPAAPGSAEPAPIPGWME